MEREPRPPIGATDDHRARVMIGGVEGSRSDEVRQFMHANSL
jgi:hypothetical protein